LTSAAWLAELREGGYKVDLVYFWLASADLAVARVAERVRTGGHDVPEATVRQRYARSVRNFFTLYRPVVDRRQFFDNSGTGGPQLIAHGDSSGQEVVLSETVWGLVKEQAQ
jgi:predicted ABC-type ATPase